MFAVATLIPVQSESTIPSIDAQVKNLAQRYNEVDAQLDRSVRYASRDDKGNTERAWFNGADDLIKLAVESHDSDVRELTEYFALDFENDYDGMFMLVRKEKPAPDGGAQVEESRKYFGEAKNGGNGVLISNPASRPIPCALRTLLSILARKRISRPRMNCARC